jgi:hypothetical protein
VEDECAVKFEAHTVGSRTHKELWVPAEELERFNSSILGRIEVVGTYYGDGFEGGFDRQTNLPVSVAAGT